MTRSERIACAVKEYNAMFILDIKKIKALGFNCKEMLQNCNVWMDNLSAQKGEQEAIFPSGTYFKINAVKRNKKTHHQRVEVWMEIAMYYQEMPDKEVPKKDQKGQQKDIKKKR